MSAPTITRADLERLAQEIADGDKFDWLAERGIEPMAMLSMAEEMHKAFRFMLDSDPDELSAIGGVAGFAFQIGFEAAEQFRWAA